MKKLKSGLVSLFLTIEEKYEKYENCSCKNDDATGRRLVYLGRVPIFGEFVVRGFVERDSIENICRRYLRLSIYCIIEKVTVGRL